MKLNEMFNEWKIEEDTTSLKKGTKIYLLKPSELDDLPSNTKVYSIFGEEKIKGKDKLDKDTRMGFTAWGLLKPIKNKS